MNTASSAAAYTLSPRDCDASGLPVRCTPGALRDIDASKPFFRIPIAVREYLGSLLADGHLECLDVMLWEEAYMNSIMHAHEEALIFRIRYEALKLRFRASAHSLQRALRRLESRHLARRLYKRTLNGRALIGIEVCLPYEVAQTILKHIPDRKGRSGSYAEAESTIQTNACLNGGGLKDASVSIDSASGHPQNRHDALTPSAPAHHAPFNEENASTSPQQPSSQAGRAAPPSALRPQPRSGKTREASEASQGSGREEASGQGMRPRQGPVQPQALPPSRPAGSGIESFQPSRPLDASLRKALERARQALLKRKARQAAQAQDPRRAPVDCGDKSARLSRHARSALSSGAQLKQTEGVLEVPEKTPRARSALQQVLRGEAAPRHQVVCANNDYIFRLTRPERETIERRLELIGHKGTAAIRLMREIAWQLEAVAWQGSRAKAINACLKLIAQKRWTTPYGLR